jgi:hypothetical protein
MTDIKRKERNNERKKRWKKDKIRDGSLKRLKEKGNELRKGKERKKLKIK